MEITEIRAEPEFPTVGVHAQKKPKIGLRLIFNPEYVDGLGDDELDFILCHEAQHVRRKDLAAAQAFLDECDTTPPFELKGWEPAHLINVACDMQINDMLVSYGFVALERAYTGPAHLGHDTQAQSLYDVMREIVEKLPPQQSDNDIQNPDGDDGEESNSDEENEKNGKYSQNVDLHKDKKEAEAAEKAKGVTKGGQSKGLSVNQDDVARWANFLAEVMDTRKQEDSWQRIPKRLAGVEAYQARDYVRPAVRPLPRKKATIAIDTSGSMDERMVKRLLAAVRNSPASFELEVITFNYVVEVWENFRNNPSIPNLGGGTDLTPVVSHVGAAFQFPERILVLTDGEFEMPNLPNKDRWIFSIYGNSAADFQNAHNVKAVQMEALIK